MKKLFFIGLRQASRYSLSEYSAYDVVLILGKSDIKNISEDLMSRFTRTHFVDDVCDKYKVLCRLEYTEVFKIIKNELENNEEALFFCQDEANIELVARLREDFKIFGMKTKEAAFFRDKMEMKLKIANSGLRVPKNCYLNQNSDTDYYNHLKDKLGDKIIIKPINSAASNGVFLVSSYEDFKLFFNSLYSKDYTYEAEEFISGRMYHVDTVIFQRKVYFIESCIFNVPPLDFTNGYSTSSFPIKSNNSKVKDFALSCVEALGMPDGIQHTEVFLNDNEEMVFIESGARAPGLFVIDLYKETFGINILDLEVSLFMNKKRFDVKTSDGKHAFSVVWPTKNGTINKNNMPALTGNYNITWNYKEGQLLKKSKNAIDILAFILVYNESYDNALKDFETLKHFEIANFITN
ncbi:ATP-grasp domain-containing protein [Flavobacterium undicola]|uniref:ATP-grasp domain-containing protein n=1 Tax=Flavobacterium undicola TaxID=1932779 RepID=UPI001376FA89|nr:ATP-grasp domain-containing protein [Flavobacterium undicola]MBA0882484.1 ATP-grasp domain-containing protein [Flavobacterium undicola]